MKKALMPVILLVLLSLTMTAAAQGGDTTLNASVVFGTIIVREGPDLSFAQVGQAAQGDTLTVTGRTEDGAWYQVALADASAGWVAEYLVALDGNSALLPVIAVETAISEFLYVPPGCDYFNIGPFIGQVGQSLVLTQGWEAATRELVDDYLSNVIQIVSFDGRLISTYSAYKTEIFYNEATDTWRVFWSFDMGPVAAGQHYTEWTQMFNSQITDGLDSDGNGQPDQYGPEAFTMGCTILIE